MESLFVGVDVSKDYFCVSGLDVQGQCAVFPYSHGRQKRIFRNV